MQVTIKNVHHCAMCKLHGDDTVATHRYVSRFQPIRELGTIYVCDNHVDRMSKFGGTVVALEEDHHVKD